MRPKLFLKISFNKNMKKQGCDVFGLFLEGCWTCHHQSKRQDRAASERESNKYGSLLSLCSSIRILSIQTGVHMMERLVMRWRWYWTLTSSIPLLLPWLLSTVENFDVMYFGLIIGPIFLNQKVFRFQFCMLCF